MSKLIYLTKGIETLVDDEDFNLCLVNWYAAYNKTINNYYAQRTIRLNGKRKEEFLHNKIAERMWLIGEIDHIDRNTLNNQRSNLRACTHSQNGANRKLQSNNTTGYRGVSHYKKNGKFKAEIKINKQYVFIGYYYTIEHAAMAYDLKAKEAFGQFANLNFPEKL